MRCVFLLLALSLVGCSRTHESEALQLRYTPPSGMAKTSESAGPPAVLRFGDGLEIRSVEGTPPPLEASLDDVLTRAGVPSNGKLLTSREGSLGVGAVTRFEVDRGDSRELLYFIPRQDRFVLLRFEAPLSEYGRLSAQVERSLGSLELTR